MNKHKYPYQNYTKYCQVGAHYVNHLVKRYYITTKDNNEGSPIRVSKLSYICTQCAEYAESWSLTLKRTRIEIVTRTLLQHPNLHN
jgi:hypothetical protein